MDVRVILSIVKPISLSSRDVSKDEIARAVILALLSHFENISNGPLAEQ